MALDTILQEVAELERLRDRVVMLRRGRAAKNGTRVAALFNLAEQTLAALELALSVSSLEPRLERDKLFGDNDDYGFVSPRHF